MNNLGYAAGIGGAVSALVAVFLYYNPSYTVTLPTEEGWLHTQPRFYKQEFEDAAGTFRDHVYWAVRPGAEASVLTWTVHPWSGDLDVGVKTLEAEFKKTMSASGFRRCRSLKTEQSSWMCREWVVERDDGATVEQRGYFAERGRTRLMVLFTAQRGHFPDFGDTGWWIENLEWRGPSIAYAY